MCMAGADSVIGVANAIGGGIMNAKAETKNFKYKTQIAINNAKTASAQAQRQQQLGIEEARKEKIEGIKQASLDAAKNASGGFDMTSNTSGQNYKDTINTANINAQSVKNQYDLKADDYFANAKTYLGQIDDYKEEYKASMYNNAVNSLMSAGSVASNWFEEKNKSNSNFGKLERR